MILFVEIGIALFVKDSFFRPIVGDFLVVILLYSIGRSLFSNSPLQIAIGVLSIAYFIEFLQYINILDILVIKKNMILEVILGTQFDWKDLLAYTLGIVFILFVDLKIFFKPKSFS